MLGFTITIKDHLARTLVIQTYRDLKAVPFLIHHEDCGYPRGTKRGGRTGAYYSIHIQ